MQATLRIAWLALALAAAGCAEIGTSGSTGRVGPKPEEMRQALLELQHGLGPDPKGWMHEVC